MPPRPRPRPEVPITASTFRPTEKATTRRSQESYERSDQESYERSDQESYERPYQESNERSDQESNERPVRSGEDSSYYDGSGEVACEKRMEVSTRTYFVPEYLSGEYGSEFYETSKSTRASSGDQKLWIYEKLRRGDRVPN